MIADDEDLQESDASEIYVKRFKTQAVFVKGETNLRCYSLARQTCAVVRGMFCNELQK